MTKVHESTLTVLSGEDLLSAYEWNTQRAKHFFCSRCGIYTFHRKRAVPDLLKAQLETTTAKTKTPPRFPEAAFWFRTSKEEDFLSLAGLAATYSPRA